MSPSPTIFRYDGTFEGWLCVVFAAYRRGELPAAVERTDRGAGQGGLFGEGVTIETDEAIARRVVAGLEPRLHEHGMRRLYHAFLSEAPGVERALLRLVQAVVDRGASALDDLRFEPALLAERWAGRVRREVHRMHAFVRFERHQTPDGGELYAATVEPDYYVLPLLEDHFVKRYPALRWAIRDARRRRALLHDESGTRVVDEAALGLPEQAPDEDRYQRLWRTYFRSVNIPERYNPTLQVRHMPKRYWPYLSELRDEVT